jgi:hypothetical protein
MTKIATVGSLKKVRSNISSLNDNKGQRPEATMPFFNYLTVTDGEASMHIVDQRLWLYDSIFPEKKKIWAKGRAMIANALYNSKGLGIHGATPFLMNRHDELMFVSRAIQEAKTRIAPAADVYFGREDLRLGLNPDMQIAGINGDNTIFEDVLEAYREINPDCFFRRYDTDEGYSEKWELVANSDCKLSFDLMVKLNTILPKNSHNGLYMFMPLNEANDPRLTPAVTASKVNDHLKYLAALQNTAKVSKSNLMMWIKNTVMHRNSFNGIPSITPEDNIKMLRANPTWSVEENWNNAEQDRIGCEIFCIILVIIVSGKVLGGLIQICQGKEPTAFQGLDAIALRAMDFAASGTDFKGLGTNTGGGTGSGNGGTKETKETCALKTGYTWNDATQTCDLDEVKPPTKQWIEGVPNGVVVGVGGAVLAVGTGLIKL